MGTAREQLQSSLTYLNDVCGGNWLSRSGKLWARSAWHHPVISAYHFACKALEEGDQAVLRSEHALQVVFWSGNMAASEELIDLKRFRQRVRLPKDCEKLMYELQAASGYRSLGYDIEFGDTSEQGNDFTVMTELGPIYVECKKKGETERDKRVANVWQLAQAAIIRAMKVTKRYAYVFLESSRDPVETDVANIGCVVQRQLAGALERSFKEGDLWFRIEHIRPAGFTERGHFGLLVISYPSESGKSCEAELADHQGYTGRRMGPLWPAKPQHGLFECSARKLPSGETEVSNVMAMGFRSLEQRDYVTTILNSLNEVRKRKQLPACGPGIICIETAIPYGGVTVEQRMDEIAGALRLKLRGEANRRISAVLITCTGKMPLTYTFGGKRVTLPCIHISSNELKHDNPLRPLPSAFGLPRATGCAWPMEVVAAAFS